jgi:hypothetical protein
MNILKKIFIPLFVAIVLFTLLSCATDIQAAASTPTQTASAAPTETPASSATVTPSPMPSPNEAETEKKSYEEIVDMRISDFVGGIGEKNDSSDSVEALIKKRVTGLINGTQIGGVLLGILDKGDNLLLVVGFEDKDGGRFASVVRIPTYFFYDPAIGRFILYKHENYEVMNNIGTLVESKDELIKEISSQEGEIISFGIVPEEIKDDSDFGDIDRELPSVIRFESDFNGVVDETKALFLEVVDNNEVSEDLPFKDSNGAKVEKIENFNDMSGVDVSKVPIIANLDFFKVGSAD